ncbi:MAG: response regulator [Proteobacteria bacterium]|nr:response regulator [Pseudomonadota bacterium]
MKMHEESAGPGEEDRGQTILIIDDDSTSLGIISNYLEDSGFIVLVARNGENGIERARYVRPDIIFLDVLMPGIDGFETCRRLKSDPATADIPVIFMTSLTDTEDKVKGFEAGAVDYVTKPFQSREVLSRAWMQLRLSALTRELQRTNEELTKHRDRLEELVDERTAEIKSVNRQLQNEITAHKRTGEKIRAQSNLLQTAIDALTHPFYVINIEDYSISLFNKAAGMSISNETSTCYALTQGRSEPCRKDGQPCPIEDIKKTGCPKMVEHIRSDKNGNKRIIEIHAFPIPGEEGALSQMIEYSIDITERKKTRELMIQTEKMMSVGGLAAGMAHEINNPLAAIIQITQNIERRISPDFGKNIPAAVKHHINLNNLQAYLKEKNILDNIKEITKSGQRAAKIVGEMLLFSRKSESEMAPANLVELMETAVELAGKDYNLKKKYDFKHIRIIRNFDSNLPRIPCTETEIEQVVLNLLTNAAWAMANEKSNDPPQITLLIDVEKEMARIEVEDNGPGMDEETRKLIFEPFFTTKPVGEGTGLGLSVSYMIITNNHKGVLEVESEPGKGAKFIIRLPLDRNNIKR